MEQVGFFAALVQEAQEHQRGAITALVCAALVLVGRLLLRGPDRHRHRFTLVCALLFLCSIPVHALLAILHYESSSLLVDFPASVLLAFSVIGVAGMVLFDIAGRSFSKMRILRDITSVIAGIVVLIVIGHQMHLNVGGLVATSAVLGGVLGFAMQETLGNIIGGIALQLESVVSIGDWVTVGEVTGQVVEIRWRSTSIVTRNDDMVIIPNGMLAKGMLTNLSRPVPWHRQWVLIDVHYRHPPNEVQRVILDALKGIPNVKDQDPAPDCIFYRAEQDHAVYAVRYRLLDLRRDDATDSEVKKRIWYALRRKGIEIPYPARNVYVTELSKEREDAKWQKEHARRMAALHKVAIFKPLDEEHLELLADKCRLEVFGADEVILRQGAPGDSLFVLRRGTVTVRVTVDKIDREVAALGEGEIFGEMSLMTGEARHATVVARTDVECYVIDHALFQEILAARASLVHDISEILAARAAELQGEVAQLDAEARAREDRRRDLVSRIKSFFGIASSAVGG